MSVKRPYIMRLIDGGTKIPNVPPAANDPRNSRSLYPRASISGYATVPTVAAVATLEPELAAKMVQEPVSYTHLTLPTKA